MSTVHVYSVEAPQHCCECAVKPWLGRRDWLDLILIGWFDRYCITLKALPIFPVTSSRRHIDRAARPLHQHLLTHVDTQHIESSSSFKDRLKTLNEHDVFFVPEVKDIVHVKATSSLPFCPVIGAIAKVFFPLFEHNS